jgi:hypothetical protein
MQFTGSFSNFFDTTMLPAITGGAWQAFEAKPKLGLKLLGSETTGKKIIQKAGVTGVGLPALVLEGGDTDTDTMVQLPAKTYRMAKYGLGIGASRELVADDEHGIISRRAEMLGESIAESIEIQAASVFNNAFDVTNYPGPDGVALCSLTHPAYKAGGVRVNLLATAADLDVASLELALIDYENMVDHRGFFQSLPTPKLLVAPANRFNAMEITKSNMRSDTANNAINAFDYAENGRIDPLVWAYLTDPDAWFLVAPKKNELLWVWRERPYTAKDYWEKSETGVVYLRYRADFGFHGDRGIYGTPGA